MSSAWGEPQNAPSGLQNAKTVVFYVMIAVGFEGQRAFDAFEMV